MAPPPRSSPSRPPDRNGRPLGPWLSAGLILAVVLLLFSAGRDLHEPAVPRAVDQLLDGDVDQRARLDAIRLVRRRTLNAPLGDRRAAWWLWSAGLVLDDHDAVLRATERLGTRPKGVAAGLPLLEAERATRWLAEPRSLERAALGEPVVAGLLRCAALATAGRTAAAAEARAAAAVSAELFRMDSQALARVVPGPH